MTIYRGPGGTGEARTDSDVTEVRIIADEAEGYKDQAATSASAAASSASAAATAETNAETAEANAETAEANAEAAQAAAEAAQAAAEAAQTAAEAAQTAAEAAQTAAELAETNAETAEANAETAEANAETAQAAAATSATNAAASASTATTQASNAASSASTATTQAGIATTKANEAASSATAAQSAQTAAESARDSALSAYDNFDDRYLGPKSSDPTLDNDGNALLTGALYYNTTSSVMKVYTGSSWVAAYVSAAGTLLAANNLSDLVSVSTARTNLGLGTAALVADSTLVHKTGDETIAGTKTFSSTITGSITGNAGTVTNGVYTTGDQTIAGTKTLSSNPILSAGTANGVAYLNGSKVLTSGSALTFDGTSFGVGTATPTNYSSAANNLVVAGTGQRGITIASTDSNQSNLFFADSDSGAGEYAGYLAYIHSSDGLAFGANASEQMRLTSTGLGIGTSSPNARLAVVGGGIRVNGYSSNSAGDGVNVQIGTTGGVNYLQSLNGTGTHNLSIDANQVTFRTGSYTTAATLDSSGNLGLGVTPSAWGTYKALQVTNASLWGAVANTYVGANYYFDGSNRRYITSAAAGEFAYAGGQFYWSLAGSGTAGNAISFTQAMTLDASGNLGIGTSSPSAKLTIGGSGANRMSFIGPSGTYYAGYDGTTDTFGIASNTSIRFQTGAYVEAARIDSSGNLLVGTTSGFSNQQGFYFGAGAVSYTSIGHTTAAVSGDLYARFVYNGTGIGSITQSGTTAVAYNTTSDYRLKENVQPMIGALARVAALKPCTYTWKSAPDEIGEGFIAHELAEVCPQAVTGEKDAVDADGNPEYQSIDTSFLVATLTAAIQELKAEFDAYKATHP